MNITVFGATGQVGKLVVSQGLASGHLINAFGRNVHQLIDQDLNNKMLKTTKGYIFEEADVLSALSGADAVISVLGGSFDGEDKTRSLGMKIIVEQMAVAGVKRIVALGGLGVLDGPDGELLLNSPDYPKEYQPVGREHEAAWQYLKQSHLNWTFVCAPNLIKGEPVEFTTSRNVEPNPNTGHITMAALAAFMLREVVEDHFVNCRVGISDKA